MNSMLAYFQAMAQLKEALNDCLMKGRVLPCLTLLYSAIDILASMERQPKEGTQKAFVRWVDTYMLPNNEFHFSSIDLYAARCGIIHAFSADSDLSRKGRARRVVYAWGTASSDSLREAGQALGRNEVTVHLSSLIDGFDRAVRNYMQDVESRPHQHELFFKSVRGWLVNLDPSVVDGFLSTRSAANKLISET
jgi:hypothetical protein